jgi:hypothetical protein
MINFEKFRLMVAEKALQEINQNHALLDSVIDEV